jgi:hypothetical protein
MPHSLTRPPRLTLGTGDLVLDLVQGGLVLEAGAVHQDAGALDDADGAEEEVDGGEEVVLGGDDEAPAGPDQAGGGQGAVLLEGELLGGAGEVGDAGDDEGPLGGRRRRAMLVWLVHFIECECIYNTRGVQMCIPS